MPKIEFFRPKSDKKECLRATNNDKIFWLLFYIVIRIGKIQ